ncbi:MAG TPA: DUF2703 domain-containing protein [Candidatus Acidoferrales bacterium]|nr:DUF2703 domain-containing protein [Candidatus Acidoferrales bacterium]
MKVEVLYVADCPSYPAAVKLIREVLAAQGVAAEIQEVLVSDERMANELKFLGSPTIRVNGRDIAREAKEQQSFGLSCRLYAGSKQAGLPSAEMIHKAVMEARGNRVKQGTGLSASVAAILSSLATVSCCLPLGFAAALGASAASAFFVTLRPWLLGFSVVLIGLGFWQQYRAKQCAVRGRLLGKVLLWAAVVVVLGMILFPQQIAGLVAGGFWQAGK